MLFSYTKRCLSALLAICICFTFLSPAVFAGSGNYVCVDNFVSSDAKYGGSNLFVTPKAGARSYFGTDSFNYYSQIDQKAKLIYNTVKGMQPGVTVATVNIGEVDNQSGTAQTYIATVLEAGVFAVFKDYPEFFWLTGSYNCNFSYNNYGTYFSNVTLTITFTNNTAYTNPALTKQQLSDAVAAVNIPYGTRYDMTKAIHDFLCNRASYSETAMAHEATGALLPPYTCVCEGYSEAFKLICDKYKIPCVLVVGTGDGGAHMWNYVCLENGIWYAVDVTWDDQNTNLFYDFFLVGSGSVPTHFAAETFDTSHVPIGYFSTSERFLFTFPALSSSAFSFPSGLYIPKDADTDYTLNTLKVNGVPVIRYGGASRTVTPTAYGTGTGSTFIVPTGTSGANETWKLIVRGDCTGDGAVNSSDMTAAMRATVKSYGIITAGSAYEQSIDFDENNVIDSADAFMLNLYENGHTD